MVDELIPDQHRAVPSSAEEQSSGTSKNRRYFSNGAKLPSNDSVSFSFQFTDVHP